jgi:hypothetical protein
VTVALSRWAPLRRFAEPALVAAAVAALYLLIAPSSADHAAQQFRAGLFEIEGPGTWNNLWFGGHHIGAYSLLYPPLGALIGTRLVGALAAVAAALLFAVIAERRWGEQARFGIIWFAAGTSISLFTGRLTFALGVTVALASVLALQSGYRRTGLCLAVLCPMASPVAALFLAAGGLAYWVGERRREGLELAAAAFGAALLLAIAFPEGGSEPFDGTSFSPALMVAAACFFALPKQEKVLRAGVAIYAVALAASFLIANPMGGNATRMGSLLLGPLLACALWRRDQRFLLIALVPLLVYWQWSPVVRDLRSVHAEPSVQAKYYAPITSFLASEVARNPSRVEIVPTENHWEAAIVPPAEIPIARGWERQLDRKLNHLFYTDTLGADKYRRWLDRLAVRYVALSDGPLDYAGKHEASLIRHGLPYLRPAFRSADWTVYEVTKATPLAQRPARLVALDADGFSIYAPHPGAYLVRIRHSSYFSLSDGVGCVEASPGGFTIVRMDQAGVADVNSDFSPLRIFEHGPACRSAP